VNHSITNKHLLSPSHTCPFVCAKYVDVLRKANLLMDSVNLKENLLTVLKEALLSSAEQQQVKTIVFLKTFFF
jgi:hypothetical protein